MRDLLKVELEVVLCKRVLAAMSMVGLGRTWLVSLLKKALKVE